jgi:hypothetical protein
MRLPARAVLLVSTILIAAACHSRQEGVRLVQAKIDGLTCDKCVPPLTKSLKNHFTSAAVDVDDDKDTATLRWKRGEAFSAGEFEQAVTAVRMRVVDLSLEACGHAENRDGARIFSAGDTHFVLRGAQEVPLNQPICVSGRLDHSSQPAVLDIGSVSAGN